jgi:outer membrane protein TolC
VTESWLRTAEARESVAIARQTLELARENLVLAEKRYETGAFDVLEFNEAQRTLTKTRNDLVVSYYGYLTSLAALDYAIGN